MIKINKYSFFTAFTLIEVILAIALIGILAGLASIGLSGFQTSASNSATIDSLISDIKNQQQNAMFNKITNSESERYGIFFKEDSYVMFQGDLFNQEDLLNLEVKLPGNSKIKNINLPQNSIIFERGSGEIVDFDPTKNSLSVSDNFTVSFSKLGVIKVDNDL